MFILFVELNQVSIYLKIEIRIHVNTDPENSNYCAGTTRAVNMDLCVLSTPNYSVNQDVSSSG